MVLYTTTKVELIRSTDLEGVDDDLIPVGPESPDPRLRTMSFDSGK